MIRNPLIPWTLLIAGIVVGLWLYRADAKSDAQDELVKEQALRRAERYAEARDSVEVEIGVREDSLRAKDAENKRLRAERDRAKRRYAALREEADAALEPDVTFTGSDSALAVRADSLLRTRLEEAPRVIPLSPGRFDTPRPLLADYANILTKTLPALERERRSAQELNSLQDFVIKAQDSRLAMTERQLSSTSEGLRLCKAECSEYQEVVEIQEGQIRRLKWWRRGAAAVILGVVLIR